MSRCASGPAVRRKPGLYLRPDTLEEAWRLRATHEGARFIAAGTDLLVQRGGGKASMPPVLISLRAIPALRGIEEDGGYRIGATATMAECAEHAGLRDTFPALAAAARTMGSAQIRAVATVGGNLCNASPCAELATPLLVYEARAEIAGAGSRREVPLEEFFRGPGQTCLAPDEVLTAVLVARPAPGSRACYRRKGRVGMDLALASVAVRLAREGGRCRGVRVAAGAVAPTPIRLPAVEVLLEDAVPDAALLAQVQQQAAAGILPISDLRASADYRRQIVGVYVRRAVEHLAGEGDS
jgi:carbon-monoxide dehydrogenase medium subunit